MTKMLKMNRNRQINLPSAFVGRLSLSDGQYFRADLNGNQIILTPVDTVDRVFTKEDMDLVEKTYTRGKKSSKPVTSAWIKRAHRGS